eukprot:Pgem_evm1s11312
MVHDNVVRKSTDDVTKKLERLSLLDQIEKKPRAKQKKCAAQKNEEEKLNSYEIMKHTQKIWLDESLEVQMVCNID